MSDQRRVVPEVNGDCDHTPKMNRLTERTEESSAFAWSEDRTGQASMSNATDCMIYKEPYFPTVPKPKKPKVKTIKPSVW